MAWWVLCSILTAAEVTVTGAPPFPPVPDSVEVSSESLSGLSDGLLQWYLSEGYPFAAVAMYFEAESTLVLNMVPGRHALLERVEFADTVRTRRSVLLRTLRLEPGRPYSARLVMEWLESLERLPFIESAGPCRLALGQGGNLVVFVPVREQPPGWFYGDLDFSSAGGFTGGGEVSFTNLFGSGRRLSIAAEAVEWGGMDGSLTYREPWIAGSPVSAELSVFQEVPDSGAVTRQWSMSALADIGSLEVSGGGGVWRSWLPGGVEEIWRFGTAGVSWNGTRSLPQGDAGFAASFSTSAGRASGPDSTYLLTMARGSADYNWYRGAIGLGIRVQGEGIVNGAWLTGMVSRIGGYGTIRGYVRDSWRAGAWASASPEVSLGETRTRLYLFSDMAVLETPERAVRYPASAGVGIRGKAGGLQFDAGAAYPVRVGLESARFFLSARVSL